MNDNIRLSVEKEINNIKDSYIKSVHRLNSDNGTAVSFTKDYAGRQIYELLQNAEDQVIDENGIVKIVLSGNSACMVLFSLSTRIGSTTSNKSVFML